MIVTNDEHRAFAEDVWKLPKGTIPSKIGFDAVAQSRALKDRKLRVYWTQVTNNIQAGPNLMQETLPGWRNPDAFVVVSDVYPTVSAQAANMILPADMWVQKDRASGNAQRPSDFSQQSLPPPGNALSDLTPPDDSCNRSSPDNVCPPRIAGPAPGDQGMTL